MNIPDSVARHVRSRTIIADVAANAETARRRMSAATGQLTKARNYLAKEDWEAAAIFAESALMVAFEAYLMGVKLKLGTTAGSHQAMADITAYLARRAGVAVEPYQLHDVVDARGALLYQPWDLVAQRELAESTVDVAARALNRMRRRAGGRIRRDREGPPRTRAGGRLRTGPGTLAV